MFVKVVAFIALASLAGAQHGHHATSYASSNNHVVSHGHGGQLYAAPVYHQGVAGGHGYGHHDEHYVS